MSDRLTREIIDILLDQEDESHDLQAEIRREWRSWVYWRQQRKVEARSRPPYAKGDT